MLSRSARLGKQVIEHGGISKHQVLRRAPSHFGRLASLLFDQRLDQNGAGTERAAQSG